MKSVSILVASFGLGLAALACNQENQPEPMTPASGSEQDAPSPGLDTNSGEPTPANTDPANSANGSGSGGSSAMGPNSPGSATGTP